MNAADKIGMDLRFFFCKVIRGFGVVVLGLYSLMFLSSMMLSGIITDGLAQDRQSSDILWKIYKEISELARFENNNFIKGEFHVNLDGNEENKEEHIVVLNHIVAGQEKMLLQVTYFESRRKNSPVKYAKRVRKIECCILNERIEIERCDFNQGEINSLLPGILEGIRVKKKILDLIG
jgi:hypothetical protein